MCCFRLKPQKKLHQAPQGEQSRLIGILQVCSKCGVHQLVSAGRGLAASAFERILNSLFLYTIQLLMYIFKNIICQWDKRSSVVGGIWSIKIVLSVGFTNWWAWEMALGAIFFQGRYFWKKTWIIQKPFFQGWVCSIFFLGLIIECVIRTPKMNHVFIYIYRSCFLED